MNPGLVVKLRPSGPWRIGPDSGARNRVDVIYHSDSLYSAVTAAMSRLGWLEEWLDATARTGSPAVSFSSCFPFVGDTVYVIPPRTIWPPASTSTKAARVRWKSARFVPLTAVQSILSGDRLDENQWSVDGPSDCLVPAGTPGPFRTAVRSNASVDRLTGASERHSTACIEFRPDSGLWTVVSFADEAAQARWSPKVKAAFRLLADTGFGGERSRGWGRSEAPEFIDGMLPDLILPMPTESAVAPEPVEVIEAAVVAPPIIEPLVVEAVPPAPETEPEPSAPETALEPGAVLSVAAPEPVEVAEAAVVAPPIIEALVVEAVPPAPDSEPEPSAPETAPADATSAPETAPATTEPAIDPPGDATPSSEPAAPSSTEPVIEPPGDATPAPDPAPSATEPAIESAPEPETAPAATEPVIEPPGDAMPAPEPDDTLLSRAQGAPREGAVPLTAVPEITSEPPAPEPEQPLIAAEAAASDAPVVEAVAIAEPAPAEPEVIAATPAIGPEKPAVESMPEPAAPEPLPEPEPLLPFTAPTHPHWLLSLFTPAPADSVDWRRGNYTVVPRGGRIDSPAGSGELKKQIQMVAEGSVLYAETPPRGSAADVAPDGFAHPVFRAGFAVAIPLPEVR
jgi:CRISPR type III-A-associated RAMP protein Csm4